MGNSTVVANNIAHAIIFIITRAFQVTSKKLSYMPVGEPKDIIPKPNINIAVYLGLYTIYPAVSKYILQYLTFTIWAIKPLINFSQKK